LFVSNSQVIGCEDRLRNDLYCVGWGVKLYSVQSICLSVCNIETQLSHMLEYFENIFTAD